jgi:hypothetical protein
METEDEQGYSICGLGGGGGLRGFGTIGAIVSVLVALYILYYLPSLDTCIIAGFGWIANTGLSVSLISFGEGGFVKIVVGSMTELVAESSQG